MAVILVKDFNVFAADRKELNRRLREAGFPELQGWKLSRYVLYAMRDVDSGKSSGGQLSAKRVGTDSYGNEIYEIGLFKGSYIPILLVKVKGETLEEIPLVDERERILHEIRNRWHRKLSYYREKVSSREISEYISEKVVRRLQGYQIAKNTYIVEDSPELHELAEIINSYHPSLFILNFQEDQKNTIAAKLREKAVSLVKRKEKASIRDVEDLLFTLKFLQREGFDFSQEIARLESLKREKQKRKAPKIAKIRKGGDKWKE